MKLPSRWLPISCYAIRKGREASRIGCEVRRLRIENAMLSAQLKLALEERYCASSTSRTAETDELSEFDKRLLGRSE